MALFSNTLSVIRGYLSSAVGDLTTGACGVTGATTAKIYAPFLWEPDDFYNQNYYEAYIYAGTNIGLTRRVTDWVLADFLLTVHSAYTVACDATSYLELHRFFTVDDYNKAINLAISDAVKYYLIDIKDESTIRLTSTEDILGNNIKTLEYSLPLTFFYLNRVTLEDDTSGVKLTGTISAQTFTDGETITGLTSGATGELSYDAATYIRVRKVTGTFVVGETASGTTSSQTCSTITAVENEQAGMGRWLAQDTIDSRHYNVIPSYPPKLKFDKRYFSPTDDLFLRLEGQGGQPTVSADTDVIYLPPGWVVQRAITYLPQDKINEAGLTATYQRAVKLSMDIPTSLPHPTAIQISKG